MKSLLDIKYMGPISFALFIDGLQAGISFALAGFMGTIGGTVGAAVWCNENLSGWQWVQGVCTLAGGAAGTALNPVLMPLGVAIGFVINICLSLTLGVALIGLLASLFGWEPLKNYLSPGFIADAIPGINNLPFWTLMTIAVSWKHATQHSELGIAGKAVRFATQPTQAIMTMKEDSMNASRKARVFNVAQQHRESQEEVVGAMQQKASQARVPMQDIRPSNKPHVQPA